MAAEKYVNHKGLKKRCTQYINFLLTMPCSQRKIRVLIEFSVHSPWIHRTAHFWFCFPNTGGVIVLSEEGEGEVVLLKGEMVLVVGASPRRGHLLVEHNNTTLHVPYQFMELKPCNINIWTRYLFSWRSRCSCDVLRFNLNSARNFVKFTLLNSVGACLVKQKLEFLFGILFLDRGINMENVRR